MHKHLLLGLALITACSGCDKKAEGQTVAVVNGEEITASELNAELSKANLASDADKKQAVSRILQGIVDRRLLAEQARKDGLDRSPDFITRQRRATEDLLIGMLVNRQLETSKLPTASEIAAFQAKQPQAFGKREIWNLDQLLYETPTDPSIGKKILQSQSLEQLATVLSESGISFQRGKNRLATNVIPADMYPQLAALRPGEPFVVPNGKRSVASAISSIEASPLTGPAARTEAVNMIRRQSGSEVMQRRLKDLRASAKIEYKEGYAAPKK
jgi:EpsD family peptidyl-prolyl cis-trans isomerase